MKRFPGIPVSRLLRTSHLVALIIVALITAIAVSAPWTLAQEETPTVTGVPDPTVRFVHASPDAPAVNILIDGQPIAEGVAFGTATEYATLSPGDHQFQVVPADGGAPVIDQTITLGGWASYILAATGRMADLQLQFNEVDVSQTAPGQARLRVLNAVPDAQTVGFGVAGSEQQMVDGVGFGTVSGYQNVTPGTYDLELRASDSGETLVLAPGVRIDAGQVYDVVALGEAAEGTIQLLPLITPVATACGESLGIGQATDSCLRVINAAPDAGPIDVYVGDAPIVEGLEYGQSSEFTATANGQQQLRVASAGDPVDQAIIDMTQDWSAGSAAQITVSGLADDLQATIAGVDLRSLPENQARVRVTHASPDLEAIDVAIAAGPTPFQNVAFRSQSGYVVFDAGSYTFQLRLNGQNTLLLEAIDVPIEPGMVYDIVVIGQSENGTLQMMILTATAGVLTGPSATPIAGTPAATTAATPAGLATPVVAVGSTPVVETPGAATPAATPTS
jgi:hypothetical protein